MRPTTIDRDLKEIEKDLGLHTCAPIGLRKEEHHQDGGAIEAVEQAPSRIRQGGLVEQDVVGPDGRGNQQNHQDGGEQEPEQGSNALRATECNPGASEGEKTNKNEDGLGKTAARPAGSEQEEAQRLGGDEGGEEKAHEPSLAKVRELAQAGAATQVEIDCRNHQLWRDTPPQSWRSAGTVENFSLLPFRSEICDLSSSFRLRDWGAS